MFCTISPSSDNKYIILKYIGDVNRRDALMYTVESHTLGKKLNINRYLVDATEAKHTDSVSDDYQFAYKDIPGADGIDFTAVVAVLANADDSSHDFIETVSRNSGLNVRLFKDRAKAVQYLVEE